MSEPASSSLRVFVASAAELLTDHVPHGEGLIAWETLSALARRGHQLVVCARKVDLTTEPPFEVIEVGAASRWESIEPVAYARSVTRLFDERGGGDSFDAVHWLFPQQPLCFTPATGATFVIGPWLSSWPSESASRRPLRLGDLVRAGMTPYLARRRKQGFSRADRILVSAPHAMEVIPASARSKTTVAPFGVDASRFAPGRLPREPRLLYVGRLEPEKGVRQLLDGFAEALQQVPDAQLLLAGEGGDRAWLENRVRELGLGRRIELLGRVPHDGVAELMQSSSALCLPSRGEPFGMVVLEAMACGIAVIASASGGPGWLVDPGRGGIVLSSTGRAELGDAIAELLGDAGRLEEMGRYNRERVEAEFTLDRIADRLEQAYRSGLHTRLLGDGHRLPLSASTR